MMHWLITALFPDAEQGMQYRMPTYKAGRDLVAWGFRSDCILLVTPSAHRIRAFRKRHPKIPASGSTLNFYRRSCQSGTQRARAAGGSGQAGAPGCARPARAKTRFALAGHSCTSEWGRIARHGSTLHAQWTGTHEEAA
jgi:hypothetical protein